jgi:hypothetical protein
MRQLLNDLLDGLLQLAVSLNHSGDLVNVADATQSRTLR